MSHSLRKRLYGWIIAVTIASGIAAGAWSYSLAFREAQELQDDQLQQVALLVGRSGKAVEPWSGVTEAEKRRDPDARIIIRSLTSAARADRPRGSGLPSDLSPNLPEGFQTITYQGERWRFYVHSLPSGARIAVGQLTEVRNEIARDSGMYTLLPILLLVPFLTLLITWIVRRSFAPVTGLARQLDHRDDTNLSPLPDAGIPEEISPFVVSINGLMLRLGESLEQQRRFIADAAHELRSPLTALTLQAENLEHGNSLAEQAERLKHLKQGLARTRSLLEQLLSLARQQSSTSPDVELHLDQLVRQVLEDVMPLAIAKGIDLGCEHLDHVVMTAPADGWIMLMRNAIDNAIRYTQPGGKVDVGLYRENGKVAFQVTDNGPGIPNGEEERIFEPFYRIVGAEETGSGLGLAIVRSIADRLGGTVSLQNRIDGTGSIFRYTQRI